MATGIVQLSTEKEVAKRLPHVVVIVVAEWRFASCAKTRVVENRSPLGDLVCGEAKKFPNISRSHFGSS